LSGEIISKGAGRIGQCAFIINDQLTIGHFQLSIGNSQFSIVPELIPGSPRVLAIMLEFGPIAGSQPGSQSIDCVQIAIAGGDKNGSFVIDCRANIPRRADFIFFNQVAH